ncbi:MAG: T9SS type A sorting domain-containing protein [Bacteroidota bacterium]
MRTFYSLLLVFLLVIPARTSFAQCSVAEADNVNDVLLELAANQDIVLGTPRVFCVITNTILAGNTFPFGGNLGLPSNNNPYPFTVEIERVSDNQIQNLTNAGDVAAVDGNTVYLITLTGVEVGQALISFEPTSIVAPTVSLALRVVEDPAMPVTWSRPLTARPDAKEVALTWSVTDQVDVAGYEIQRSVDNRWESVATVPVRELSGEIHYVATDLRQPTITYYRVRQTDFDGTVDFSNVVQVAAGAAAELLLYPNPSTQEVFVRSTEAIGRAKIYNRWGQLMRTVDLDVGTNRMSVHDLPPGNYLIVLPGKKETLYFQVSR